MFSSRKRLHQTQSVLVERSTLSWRPHQLVLILAWPIRIYPLTFLNKLTQCRLSSIPKSGLRSLLWETTTLTKRTYSCLRMPSHWPILARCAKQGPTSVVTMAISPSVPCLIITPAIVRINQLWTRQARAEVVATHLGKSSARTTLSMVNNFSGI